MARRSRCLRWRFSLPYRSAISMELQRKLRRRSNPPSNFRHPATIPIGIRMMFARSAPWSPWQVRPWSQRRRPCRSRKLSNLRIHRWMQRSSTRAPRARPFNHAHLPSPDTDLNASRKNLPFVAGPLGRRSNQFAASRRQALSYSRMATNPLAALLESGQCQ